MFIRTFYISTLLAISFVLSFSQSDFDVYDYWERYPEPGNTLYQQFLARAAIEKGTRENTLEKFKTKDHWQARQKHIREKLLQLIGPLPDRLDLNPQTTGVIDREGFKVEKMHFQAQPGLYVTAALFIPKNINLPAPAILFCSGHAEEGFRSATYQHMILNYVRKGFIVLAFDPIGQGERYQYFDDQGATYLSPTREHSYPGNQMFINGISPANYFIWDGIRAIDYLVSRPEVDPTRIGVTGRSGGGTQAAYLMAIDDRIAAAAPECYLTTYDRLLKSIGPQDAEQIILHFLANGLDLADLVNVRAPKPTLMVTTTRDIFSIQGARELFEEAHQFYALAGSPENLTMVEDDAPHASTKKNREATYAFFQKHLNNPGKSDDETVDTFSVKELWITNSGQVTKDLKSETMFSLNKKYADVLKDRRTQKEKAGKNWTGLQNDIIDLSKFQRTSAKPEVIFSGATAKSNHRIEKYLYTKKMGSPIPIVWLKPDQNSGKTILLLNETGKSQQAETYSLASQLVSSGHQVIMPDLSGVGELSGGYKGGDAVLQGVPINVWYAGILLDKSPLILRVEEIQMIIETIKALVGKDVNIHGIAIGTLSADLLHAATLGVDFTSMLLIDPLISYESLLNTEHYLAKYIPSAVAGSFPIYDLPELCHFAPENFCVINAKDATGEIVAVEESKHLYGQYREHDQTTIMNVTVEDINSIAIEWISKTEK